MPVLPPDKLDLINMGVKQVVTCDYCGREIDWLKDEWEARYFLGELYQGDIKCWHCKKRLG